MALDLGGLPRPRAAGGVTATLDLEGAAFWGGIVSEQKGKVVKVRERWLLFQLYG